MAEALPAYGRDAWDPPDGDALAEFHRFVRSDPVAVFEARYDELTQRQANGWMDKEAVARRLVEFIGERARRGEPFSIVRLNEGEGSVLFPEVWPEYPALGRYVVRRISSIVFGHPAVVEDHQTAFRGFMRDAAATADIVGIPAPDFLRRHVLERPAGKVDVRAVCGAAAQVAWIHRRLVTAAADTPQHVTRAWLSRLLLPHYHELMTSFERVVVITGHRELPGRLAAAHPHLVVQGIVVPGQRALREDSTARHYPDRYGQVVGQLEKLETGTLVLLAAGLAGKGYAAVARRRGASVLDIGHVADLWMGVRSRPGVDDELLRQWRLPPAPAD